jgi:nucleotidyltransferase substrate binding protein (TIGR01987 family)
MAADVRWKQRFDNFDRAFVLLREVCERGVASLSQLEREGAVQRFEFAFELAWKTLKDYLEENGVIVDPVTPRNVIKEAFAAKLLDDGQVWIDMLHHRNLLAHTYDFKTFEAALQTVEQHYFAAFDRLHEFFLLHRMDT